MEPRREDIDLASELRLLRLFPRPEFAAELDARAAAGFPRGTGNSRVSLTLDRLRTIPARRLLAPAGACALAAIVVATAVVALESSETTSSTTRIATSNVGRGVEAASPPSGAVAPGVRPSNHARSTAAAAGSVVRPEAGDGSLSAPIERQGPGPYASHANHRSVERSASIVLGADADEVRGVSAKVFETVHSYDGIVLHSSIASGGDEGASAMFDLLIPSAKLGDALAALSGLAESAPATIRARTSPPRRSGSGNAFATLAPRSKAFSASLPPRAATESAQPSKPSCTPGACESLHFALASPRSDAVPISHGSRCGSSPNLPPPQPVGATAGESTTALPMLAASSLSPPASPLSASPCSGLWPCSACSPGSPGAAGFGDDASKRSGRRAPYMVIR